MSQHDSQRPTSEIIRGLTQTPAYLLVFGIAFLICLLTTGVLASRAEQGRSWLYVVLGLASLVVALVVAFLVIRLVERRDDGEVSEPRLTRVAPVRTGEARIDAALATVADNLRVAVRYRHPVLLEQITDACNDLAAASTNWRQGQVTVPPARYNDFLRELYEKAERSVFATSIPEYFPTWTSSLGTDLLRSHKRSDAEVTRVFVFDRPADVTPEVLAEMDRQQENDVRVLVYLDEEDKFFDFPPDISRDFTVIDDEVIGITRSYGRDNLEAVWYFHDATRAQKFARIRESLTRGSEPLAEFRRRAPD